MPAIGIIERLYNNNKYATPEVWTSSFVILFTSLKPSVIKNGLYTANL